MHFIYQIKNNDCGFTAFKILCANVFKDKSFLFIPHPDKDDQPYSFKQLEEEGRKVDVILSSFKVNDKNELIKNKEWPLLLIIKGEDDEPHAVVAYRIGIKYIYYLDPLFGKKKMLINDFIFLWSGYGIKIDNKDDKVKYRYVEPVSISTKDKILSLFLNIIGALSLIAASFFITRDVYYVIPIILAGIFAICEMLGKAHNIKLCQNIDLQLYGEELSLKTRNNELYIKNVELIKKNLLSFYTSFVSNLISVAFICILFLLNGSLNIIYIIMSVMFSLLYESLLKPLINKYHYQINREENKIITSDTIDVEQLKSTYQKVYKVVNIELVIKYFFFFLLAIATLVIMSLSNVISLPYILFYLAGSYFLYNNLINIYEEEERNNQLNKEIILINDLKE